LATSGTTGTPSASISSGTSMVMPLILGRVHLIERDHHRQPQLDDLAGEEEIAFEMRRVGDDDDHVGRQPSRARPSSTSRAICSSGEDAESE
jgi:hypothetical protein